MDKIKSEFLIDTDVLIDHLEKKRETGFSSLVELMFRGLCFTTVINAAEIMLNADNTEDEFNAKSLLSALKVLGIHSRYSLSVNKLKMKNPKLRDSLFLVSAEVNKLNVVTLHPDKYNSDKIKIIHPVQIIQQSIE